MDHIIEIWTGSLPEEATAEHVGDGFWYVRIPGAARRWIPIEIEGRERTVKVTSYVIVPPEEREADVYELLLKKNFRAGGVSFAIDPTGLVCLVGRIAREDLDPDRLDAVIGRIVEATEETFRSILQIGFGSRLRRSGG